MSAGLLLDVTVVVLSWAAVATKVPSAPTIHHAARAWLWLNLIALALALTLGLSPVYALVGQGVGIPNLAWLLKAILLLTAAWAMLAWLASVHQPGPSARRLIAVRGGMIAAAGAVMVVLFALAPRAPDTRSLVVEHGHIPLLAACVTIHLVALSAALLVVVRALIRYATLADRPALRRALWVTAAGGMLTLTALVYQALILAYGRVLSTDPPDDLTTAFCIVCVSGLCLIAMGVGSPKVAQWTSDFRAHRKLYPLWLFLRRSSSEALSLLPTIRHSNPLATSWLGFLIYRQVVEINAAHSTLRPADSSLLDLARRQGDTIGLAGEELEAFVEATLVAFGLRSHRGNPTSGQSMHDTLDREIDIRGETLYWLRIAAHFSMSPMGKHQKKSLAIARICAP